MVTESDLKSRLPKDKVAEHDDERVSDSRHHYIIESNNRYTRSIALEDLAKQINQIQDTSHGRKAEHKEDEHSAWHPEDNILEDIENAGIDIPPGQQ